MRNVFSRHKGKRFIFSYWIKIVPLDKKGLFLFPKVRRKNNDTLSAIRKHAHAHAFDPTLYYKAMNLCLHLKLWWCHGALLLILWGRHYQGWLFLDLKGLKRTLMPTLSPTRYFSHVVTEEGKVPHKTFAEASFSTNVLECSDIFHMLEKFSLPFISISLLLPTTDFCLLIIWSNISVSMTDCIPHSCCRTKENLPDGWAAFAWGRSSPNVSHPLPELQEETRGESWGKMSLCPALENLSCSLEKPCQFIPKSPLPFGKKLYRRIQFK